MIDLFQVEKEEKKTIIQYKQIQKREIQNIRFLIMGFSYKLVMAVLNRNIFSSIFCNIFTGDVWMDYYWMMTIECTHVYMFDFVQAM